MAHETKSSCRMRSNNASISSKSSDDLKSFRKCVSESGAKKFSSLKKSDSDSLSKSLLSVPSIFVDNIDTESIKSSSAVDSSSLSEGECSRSTSDLTSLDAETISMIVRNVAALENRRDSDGSDGKLVEIELPKCQPVASNSEPKVESPKKHDFIHDLKGSIQEKFHHISDNIKLHKKDSPPTKSKERFHDLRENVSGKFHQIAEKMHHFHLPHLPHHHQEEVHHDGLVAQAMQTILMEKFNIAEASTAVNMSAEATQKRKSSSSSLQSIKEKFNLFQRPRRSLEHSETSSLKSISEVMGPCTSERSLDDAMELEDDFFDEASLAELKVHEEPGSATSDESIITILSRDRKTVSKEDLRLSVENFDSFLSAHPSFSKDTSIIADTNNKPLHASLLSLTRNELLSTSPGAKIHARTESIGSKFPASPAKNALSSMDKSQITPAHRRSSDSDLSITPKGESSDEPRLP